MTKNQITDEIRRLPLARNRAVDNLAPRLESVAAALANAGVAIRKGGFGKSASSAAAYLYATPAGGEESRIFEAVTRSSGFFTPISGKKLEDLLVFLEALIGN